MADRDEVYAAWTVVLYEVFDDVLAEGHFDTPKAARRLWDLAVVQGRREAAKALRAECRTPQASLSGPGLWR